MQTNNNTSYFFLNAPLGACIKVHYKAINGLSRSHMELITLKQAIFSKQNLKYVLKLITTKTNKFTLFMVTIIS